jgi:Spy/CpxP family protein refolding chaperone
MLPCVHGKPWRRGVVSIGKINSINPEWSLDMKRMNLRSTLSGAALIGAMIMTTTALADPPQGGYGPGYGMGPGMMGNYGQGYGHGMGPGMMGNYGQGYGYGMGPGMMGGFGPDYGMGSGTMGGYGARSDLNLNAEQRSKIAKVQNDVRRKHWEIMGKMQDEQALMNEQLESETRDDAALSKGYRKMSELRHQMFDLSLSAQKQINAVLTKEQRDKMKRG